MSGSTSTSPVVAESSNQLNPIAVFFALGSKIRWPIVQLLADGTPRTATDVASALGRDFDGVSKHLRLMRDAGVVDAGPGEDRRLLFFFIPAANRQEPGLLDYGICTVRVATARPTIAKD
jgi:hypothetical protein